MWSTYTSISVVPRLEDLCQRSFLVQLFHFDHYQDPECVIASQTAVRLELWGDLGAQGDLLLSRAIESYPCHLTNSLFQLLLSPTTKSLRINKHTPLITSEKLTEVISRLTHLIELDLSYNSHLVFGLVKCLYSCSLHLSVLKLDNCKVVIDEVIHSVVSILRHSLRVLSLSNCKNITNSVLSLPSLRHSGRLEEVNLAFNPQLTTEAIRHLVNFTGPSLMSISMFSMKITYESLLLLVGFSLESVDHKRFSQTQIIPPTDSIPLRLLLPATVSTEPCPPAASAPTDAVSDADIQPSSSQPVLLSDIDFSFTSNNQMSLCGYSASILNTQNVSPSNSTFPDNHSNQNTTSSKHSENVDNQQNNVETQSPLILTPKFPCLLKSISLDYLVHPLYPNHPPHPPNQSPLVDPLIASCQRVAWEVLLRICGHSLHRFEVLGGLQVDTCLPELVAQFATHVRILDLSENRGLEAAMMTLGNRLENLEEVNLSYVMSDDWELLKGFVIRRGLTKLDIQANGITDESCHLIGQELGHQLEYLDISWCEALTWLSIHFISLSCTHLICLFLRCLPAHSDDLHRLLLANPALEELNMSRLKTPAEAEEDGPINETVVTPLVMQAIASLVNLKVLDLSWNIEIEDVSIINMFACCLSLHTVNLGGLVWITNEPLELIVNDWHLWRRHQILMKKKLLRIFQNHDDPTMTPCTPSVETSEEPLESILPFRSIMYAPSLKKLDLEYCNGLNETILSELVAICRGSLEITDVFGVAVRPRWYCFTGVGYVLESVLVSNKDEYSNQNDKPVENV